MVPLSKEFSIPFLHGENGGKTVRFNVDVIFPHLPFLRCSPKKCFGLYALDDKISGRTTAVLLF